jgi:hypothetical protein
MGFRTLEFEGLTLVELPGWSGVYSCVTEVDVAMADRLLERNTHNRHIRVSKTAELVRGFENGDWQLNGEAIKFDWNGVLLDGQHRCKAIKEVGEGAYPSVLIWGLDPKSQETMDQVLKRAAFEQMTLAGIDADATLAATIRVLIRWQDGLLFTAPRSSRVTNTNIVAWGLAHPDAIERLREFSARGYRRIIGCPPSITMAVAYRLDQIAPKTAQDFFSGLLSPVGIAEGSPILALRQRLERILATRYAVPDRDLIGYYIAAWNGYRDGRNMAQVLGPRGGKWLPETFPVPR